MSPDKTKKEENALVLSVQANVPAELQDEMLAEIEATKKEMMDNIELRPPIIKIAAAGTNVFLFGEDGDIQKEFVGVVLGYTKNNAFWWSVDKPLKNPIPMPNEVADDFDPENMPLCYSRNGRNGSRDAELFEVDGKNVSCFGKCSECWLNQFGTARGDDGSAGKGKACSNRRRLIVLPEGMRIPHIFNIPPTSITAWDKYCTSLNNKGLVDWAVWTQFQLNLVDGGKVQYSTLKPSYHQIIDDHALVEIYKFRKQYKHLLESDISDEEFMETPLEAEAEVYDDDAPFN